MLRVGLSSSRSPCAPGAPSGHRRTTWGSGPPRCASADPVDKRMAARAAKRRVGSSATNLFRVVINCLGALAAVGVKRNQYTFIIALPAAVPVFADVPTPPGIRSWRGRCGKRLSRNRPCLRAAFRPGPLRGAIRRGASRLDMFPRNRVSAETRRGTVRRG